MPDARCPMHVGYLMLLRKAIASLSLNSITKRDAGAEVELTPEFGQS
jgi:hypothetical protein